MTTASLRSAAFLSDDRDARPPTVEVASGSALDALALAEANYPLGPVDQPGAMPADGHACGHPALTPDWRPVAYRIEKTDVGANVNYDCYCGCDTGFALDRRRRISPSGHAAAAMRCSWAWTPVSGYRVDIQQVTMPWGQPMGVVLVIPRSE
ncbi:MAG: hypothetical protein O2924_00290 [Chloroflexi bacterium]|nr:hypothetical protein [Chloroflexota bacterium]MQC16653.1 hypothetical protein [Chloroflexota bacterium]